MLTAKLFEFIKKSPTAYHTVNSVKKELEASGFIPLFEGERMELTDGGRYYITKNGSSIIAFVYRAVATGFNIIASHSDTPTFRVKASGVVTGAYSRLGTERYGGMIYSTWFDRPLSVAGRALVSTDYGIEEKLVNLDSLTVTIPSVAIHLNREVNNGYAYNPAIDLLPLFSDTGDGFMELVAENIGVNAQDILSHDLFLYTKDEPRKYGRDNEFILSPRLDDLGCVFSSLEAFKAARATSVIPVLAVFDNEEVGSQTKQGAASSFLYDTLLGIAKDNESLSFLLSNSVMISADNGHAKHPNHPELSDSENAPRLNGGVIVKYNANQRYTTDGVSDAILRTVAKRSGARLQNYYNRGDILGGSTLGSIADTKVSVPTVDIGLPQLAMHSAVESCGASDIADMVSLMTEFYSTPVVKCGGKIKI